MFRWYFETVTQKGHFEINLPLSDYKTFIKNSLSPPNCQTFRYPWSMSCFGWEQQWVLINILPIYLRHAFCHFGICTTRPVFIFSQWSQKLHEFACQFSCFFNFMTNFRNFFLSFQWFRVWKNSCTLYHLGI